MSTPDTIPARMAELNKTLEQLNRFHEQGSSVTATCDKIREVASEIIRLSKLELPVITSCSTCHPRPPVPISATP